MSNYDANRIASVGDGHEASGTFGLKHPDSLIIPELDPRPCYVATLIEGTKGRQFVCMSPGLVLLNFRTSQTRVSSLNVLAHSE